MINYNRYEGSETKNLIWGINTDIANVQHIKVIS